MILGPFLEGLKCTFAKIIPNPYAKNKMLTEVLYNILVLYNKRQEF